MVIIQLPEANVDDIEILIAEEVRIEIDIVLCLDVEERLEDVGPFELPETHLVVVFAVRHVEHPMHHAEGVPFLEFRRVLEEV